MQINNVFYILGIMPELLNIQGGLIVVKNTLSFNKANIYFLLNTLNPRQNGRHLTVDIFKFIFLDENLYLCILSYFYSDFKEICSHGSK